jgi:hypothetical protein
MRRKNFAGALRKFHTGTVSAAPSHAAFSATNIVDTAKKQTGAIALSVSHPSCWLPRPFVLTTPWNAAETAIRAMGDLSGKIILDATNALAVGPDGLSGLSRCEISDVRGRR